MATRSYRDRVRFTTSTTGTGTITQGSAVSGYQLAAAGDDGKEFTIRITDGTAWETSKSVYTHAGTTWTRVLIASSTGSLLSLNAGADVAVDWIADDAQSSYDSLVTHISGLVVTRSSTTAIAISAGQAWVPAAGKIVTYAGGTNSPSLGASTKYSVFLNADGSIEVQNEDPPSAVYHGSGRIRAAGNAGRWLGFFLTNASSQIRPFDSWEAARNHIIYIVTEGSNAAPYRVLSAGTATAYGSITTMLGTVPRYVTKEALLQTLQRYGTTAGSDMAMYLSIDGSLDFSAYTTYHPNTTNYSFLNRWHPIEASTPGIYYRCATNAPGVGPQMYIDTCGWKAAR